MDLRSVLLTDLYQLTMLEAYWREAFTEPAVFELFVRKLPPNRNFLVAAGLEGVLDYLQQARFHPDEFDYLSRTKRFSDRFLEWLAEWRFEGDVDALPEGTIFFPDEPIVRITAPMPQAQLVETRLVNLIQFPTMVASKAARCVLAAPDRTLVEFGARRAHGAEAAMAAARAACAAGFRGTSNVLAGKEWDLPIFGTMAHSYVMSHDEEWQAFVAFGRAQPNNVVLLIDTYDEMEAIGPVVRAAEILREEGIRVRAVRLDSGDLSALSHAVRRRLDAAGWPDIEIFASGDLDEWALKQLVEQKAPIRGFGVGTRLTTCSDAPYLGIVYKLQEYAGRARRKTSHGKQTWPGRKQIYRIFDSKTGGMSHDVLALEEDRSDGQPLLVPVMRSGRRMTPAESIDDIRRRVVQGLKRLPPALRELDPAPPYKVEVAPSVRELAAEVDRRHRNRSL